MFRNYLLTTFRIFSRAKVYTLINLTGITIGLGIFIIVFLYLEFEYGFDKHYDDADNIYRVTTDMIWEQGPRQQAAVTPGPTAIYFQREFSEVIASTRFISEARSLIVVERQFDEKVKYYEDNVVLADSTFFDVFRVPFYAGNPETALSDPNSVVISQKLSEKLFGKPDARGEMMILNNNHTYKVTGIIKDMPQNSHIHMNMIVSGLNYPVFTDLTWRDLSFFTYVKLRSEQDAPNLERKFDAFYDRHFPHYKSVMEFRLQKMVDIHLQNDREFDRSITADPDKLKVLLIVAVLVLVLANFNFINLATAKASYRVKEIGIRKIIGARKIEITWQLLSESFILSLISLSIVIFIIYNFSEDIKSFARIDFQFIPLKHIPIFLSLTMITSLLSGIYPAILLSRFNPLRFINSSNVGIRGRNSLRNVLIVFQFASTLTLLTALGVVFHQMQFIKNKDLGFNQDQILTVPIWNDTTYQTTVRLKDALEQYKDFSSVSIASFSPGEESNFEHFKPQDYESHVPLRYINVDPDYIETLKLQLLAGRDFKKDSEADKKSVIINESALETFGWTVEEALGKTIEYNFSQSWDELIEGRVIGIIKNFNYGSLRDKIDPVVLTMHLDFYPNLILKIKGDNISNALNLLENHYEELNSSYPLEYSFLDDKINFQYKSEQQFEKIMVFFTILAILISAMGLYGLSSFVMEKRMKEISIRKVHGASFQHLYYIFTENFIRWIIISLILSIPPAWFFCREWLSGFAYHIDFNIFHVFVSLVIVLFIVFSTVSYHAVSIASKNPSKILKSE